MIRLDLKTTPLPEVIATTVKVLGEGGLVIFPTETTYGAGVDATNPAAVQTLLKYKSRREGKPLSIAVYDQAMASQYVEINESAQKLYQRFLPGPLTVVSKSLGTVALGVESEFGTVGVRIPDYPLIRDIVKTASKPMTATSANASNAKRPYSIDDIFEHLSGAQKSLISLILDAGDLPIRPPSTVIDTTAATPVVFRQGSVEASNNTSSYTFESHSPEETHDLAGKLLLKYWNQLKETGLVVGLDGSLGTGKTIFTKGVADFLGITETLTSPTYTLMEEYDFERHTVPGRLYHLDVWRIDSEEQLARLELPSLWKPNTVIVIEWFSQVSQWLTPALTQAKIPLLKLSLTQPINQDATTHRHISIHEPEITS